MKENVKTFVAGLLILLSLIGVIGLLTYLFGLLVAFEILLYVPLGLLGIFLVGALARECLNI